jgi:hypothetical protein
MTVVWLKMMDTDLEPAAIESSNLVNDARSAHFYDPDLISGKAFAASMGSPGEVAWDMYMFFAPGVRWGEQAPLPTGYAHQLEGGWADQKQLHQADDLTKNIAKMMRELVLAKE